MFKRIYVEITNVCNLACSFCPGTSRRAHFMSAEEFRTVARKIRPFTDYIYLHVMGEPLLHPELVEILSCASELGFKINLTTNGTLLNQKGDIILSTRGLRKVSVSLHSFEGNNGHDLRSYLDSVWDFCTKADCIVALRLWNEGGANRLNGEIMDYLSERTGRDVPSLPCDANGRRLGGHLYLESADKFEWPSPEASEQNVVFCHGLSEQLAILCDGTVVPCCLDGEGVMALGNIFEEETSDILDSPRARAIIKGFELRHPTEEMCLRCSYAARFH